MGRSGEDRTRGWGAGRRYRLDAVPTPSRSPGTGGVGAGEGNRPPVLVANRRAFGDAETCCSRRSSSTAATAAGRGTIQNPPAADAPDRALETQPVTRQDVGPAQRSGFTEPERAEGEDEQQCAVPSGPPVPPQLLGELQRLGRGECAGRPGGLRRAGAAQPARVGGDGRVGDRDVEDGAQEPVRPGQRCRPRRPADCGPPRKDGGRGDLVDGGVGS
jgi:hypothetical protein